MGALPQGDRSHHNRGRQRGQTVGSNNLLVRIILLFSSKATAFFRGLALGLTSIRPHHARQNVQHTLGHKPQLGLHHEVIWLSYCLKTTELFFILCLEFFAFLPPKQTNKKVYSCLNFNKVVLNYAAISPVH